VWNEGGAVVGEKSSSSRGTYIILSDILSLSESYPRTKYGGLGQRDMIWELRRKVVGLRVRTGEMAS
jgi:hypothetical protein